MSGVDVTTFPKRCACCGKPLHLVKKMRTSWFECRNPECLVRKLGEQEDRRRETELTAYLERMAKRRKARGEG